MTKMYDGGPAFPFVCQDVSKFQCHDDGMSLRDWFAGQAMAGLLAMCADPKCNALAVDKGAEAAYLYADAMIQARKEKP